MKRARAIFTMAKNESVFLPHWVRYYSQHIDPIDIIVLDHASDDDTIPKIKAQVPLTVVHLDYPIFNDFGWYMSTIRGTFERMLQNYELVIFTEPDEFLFHPSGLGNYLDGFPHDIVCATGYDIHHQPDLEPALDLTRPVFSQRRFWVRSQRYDKALIGKVPIEWAEPGFHTASNCSVRDPNLLLLHLHKMDYTLAHQKHERTARYRWNQLALDKQLGIDSKFIGEEFKRWYHEDSRRKAAIEEIPNDLRVALSTIGI